MNKVVVYFSCQGCPAEFQCTSLSLSFKTLQGSPPCQPWSNVWKCSFVKYNALSKNNNYYEEDMPQIRLNKELASSSPNNLLLGTIWYILRKNIFNWLLISPTLRQCISKCTSECYIHQHALQLLLAQTYSLQARQWWHLMEDLWWRLLFFKKDNG